MTFQEIFKEEGLYVSDSFAEGVAFKIKKNSTDNELELVTVQYKSKDDIMPIETITRIYERLFRKDYVKVYTRQGLF
jgi:hypothetical protein